MKSNSWEWEKGKRENMAEVEIEGEDSLRTKPLNLDLPYCSKGINC